MRAPEGLWHHLLVEKTKRHPGTGKLGPRPPVARSRSHAPRYGPAMFGPHDGRRVVVHPYRRMMQFLMRRRNESAVYFEQHLDLSRTIPWLASRGGARATLFHLVLHGLASVLHERERLNRFTVGRKVYQRTSVELSFAAKKAMHDDAPLATVKRRFDRDESFGTLVDKLTARSAAPAARRRRRGYASQGPARAARLPARVPDRGARRAVPDRARAALAGRHRSAVHQRVRRQPRQPQDRCRVPPPVRARQLPAVRDDRQDHAGAGRPG